MKPIRKIKNLKSLPNKVVLFCLLPLLFLVAACEPDNGDEDPISIRDKYLGSWQVTENTGINHPQFYSVNITAGDTDDEVVIEGLYNLSDTKVGALISGTQITIPNQRSAEVNFVGNGSANADYNQIALSFTADDGSGPDNVEAVLVK